PGRGRGRPGTLPRQPLLAAAAAAAVRHGGGGAAAVLLLGGRAAARRLPRRLPGFLGALPVRGRFVLRCRWLPDPADLEPPVVRGLPVGLHGGAVAAVAAGAAAPGPRRRRAGTRPVRLGAAAVAGAGPGPGAAAADRPLRFDPRPGRRLVQPRPVLRGVPARLSGRAPRRVLGRGGAPALAGPAAVAGQRGRAGRLYRFLRRQRAAPGPAPGHARGVGRGPVVRDRRRARL